MKTLSDLQPSAGADILIVDDHREITEMVAEALLDEGYRVRIAHDGAAALGEIRRHRPDLVLLDVAMPIMTGDQLLAQLRSEGEGDLPVILMTADRAPERFRAIGAHRLLSKPFDIARLSKMVADCVARAAAGAPWAMVHREREAGV